ncbi:hypothetical protein [Nocardiopsis alba]|uniref:Uncharacterized protein n=1 Tax=Nocardiopsis alba (strain ATCC BAA-2165 / BE74) TaxID=1205910 RepID=J7L5C4_NOCAA|nr:hypothetical protein [Nocardiopsis alba]AFR08853.1 hypothetical protein B005_5132 [Nocardiopsis alba ATCC BAA-2165]
MFGFLTAIAAGLFLCRVALGIADLLVRILAHKAGRRWPGLHARNVSPRAPMSVVNEIHGDGRGTIVQVGRIDRLHLHTASPADPDPP